MARCGRHTDVYSRVCGYCRPVNLWNRGKREEFAERVNYDVDVAGKKDRMRQDVVDWSDAGAAAAD